MIQKRYAQDNIPTCILVGDDGSIFYEPDGIFLQGYSNPAGYRYIQKRIPGGREIRKAVHQMVAETFIPNPSNKPYVNHKDGNKSNNCASNLEWTTPGENSKHAYATGLRKPLSPKKVTFTKYTEDQVHLACKEIEKNELTLYEIEKLSGIPHKTLCDIRNGHIWKSISSQYHFPKKTTASRSKWLTPDQKIEMEKLVTQGVPTDMICEMIGIPSNRKNKSGIDNTRRRLNRTPEMIKADQEKYHEYYQKRKKKKLSKLEKKLLKMNNVQRLSKAQDNTEEWEEMLLYSSDLGSE